MKMLSKNGSISFDTEDYEADVLGNAEKMQMHLAVMEKIARLDLPAKCNLISDEHGDINLILPDGTHRNIGNVLGDFENPLDAYARIMAEKEKRKIGAAAGKIGRRKVNAAACKRNSAANALKKV